MKECLYRVNLVAITRQVSLKNDARVLSVAASLEKLFAENRMTARPIPDLAAFVL